MSRLLAGEYGKADGHFDEGRELKALSGCLRGFDESLMSEVAVPDAGEHGDVAHEGRADMDLAVFANEDRLKGSCRRNPAGC